MYMLLIMLLIGCESVIINDSVGCNFCIRKCCRKGFYYRQDLNSSDGIGRCLQNATEHFNVTISNIATNLYDSGDGLINCSDQKLRYFSVDSKSYLYVQQIGNLYYSRYKTRYSYMEYCVDKEDELTYYSCDQKEFMIPISAKITNLTFLLVTFLIFVIIPERNIHEKAVVFHTLCLTIANLITMVNEYYNSGDDLLCSKVNTYIFLGYLLLYFTTASDFWLNTMCIEIWYTFSDIYLFRRSDNERRLLIFLSSYAWGMPGLILLIVILLKTSDQESSYFYPGIEKESCCFRGVPYHVFDNGPKLILFVFNTILNILTIFNIQKINKESSVATRADSKCQTCVGDLRFNLYWKLCFITTYSFINFFHSLLVVAYDSPVNPRSIIYFIYYGEFLSTTYGVAFFATFIFKKRIWKGLKHRYNQIIRKLKIYESCTSVKVFRNFGNNEKPGIPLTTFYSTKEESGADSSARGYWISGVFVLSTIPKNKLFYRV